jgi:hypothetical protein
MVRLLAPRNHTLVAIRAISNQPVAKTGGNHFVQAKTWTNAADFLAVACAVLSAPEFAQGPEIR